MMSMMKPPLRIPRLMIEQWDGIVPTPSPGYCWMLLPDLDALELQQVPVSDSIPDSLGSAGRRFSPQPPAEAGKQPEEPRE